MIKKVYMFESHSWSVPLAVHNCYTVVSCGRVTRFLTKILKKLGIIEDHYDNTFNVTTLIIDTDDVVQRLLKTHYEIMKYWHKDGQELIIGAEDYKKLMGCPRISREITFTANGPMWRDLTIRIIPWMSGMVII